jgi:hypothetical protein
VGRRRLVVVVVGRGPSTSGRVGSRRMGAILMLRGRGRGGRLSVSVSHPIFFSCFLFFFSFLVRFFAKLPALDLLGWFVGTLRLERLTGLSM